LKLVYSVQARHLDLRVAEAVGSASEFSPVGSVWRIADALMRTRP
jgi:hypothetical protein